MEDKKDVMETNVTKSETKTDKSLKRNKKLPLGARILSMVGTIFVVVATIVGAVFGK